MFDHYTKYRIYSVSNPSNHFCLVEGFAGTRKKHFSSQELRELDCSLYSEDFVRRTRGQNWKSEQLVLQGFATGDWETIKKVSLLKK